MNYTHLVQELNSATTFDLYRLHVAIGNELKNPKRILSIKRNLRVGMQLSYFYHAENRLIKSKLLKMGENDE